MEDYVACVYDNLWYIGRIVDMDDDDVHVTFLEKTKENYRWPYAPDIIWRKTDVQYKLKSLGEK